MMESLSAWLTGFKAASCPSCDRELGPIDWKDDMNWVTTFQRIDEALAIGCLKCIFTVDCLKACPTTANIDYSLIVRAKAWNMHNFMFVRVRDEGSEDGLREIDLELFFTSRCVNMTCWADKVSLMNRRKYARYLADIDSTEASHRRHIFKRVLFDDFLLDRRMLGEAPILRKD